jgi:osmotically-inducible protein OsmY
VTLTGTVDNYAKKIQAENAAKHIKGVKAVVEKIEVKFNTDWTKHDDNDIAKEIVHAYKWNWQLPDDKIHVKVENGWITLDGETNWNYQREEAKNAIKDMTGIKGVTNNITIKLEADNKIEKNDIEAALKRNWSVKNENIEVAVMDHRVTLSGNVSSWYQKDEAARMAWSAPGVWAVDNQLEVVFEYDYVS